MGMSASQVRLLTLQDRKSTIGFRLGSLATQKRMLNRQMTKLANDYNASFSSKKLQWYDTINNNYTDITYANLMTPTMNNSYTPFLLTDRASGNVVLDGANPVSNSLMSTHMNHIVEDIGGMSAAHYVPGSLSLTQDMEFYIIEDMLGVQDFNRYKMRYTPIENLEKSYPQVNHVSNITLLENFTTAVGSTAASHANGKMYLNGSGSSYNYFNEFTLWKAAYESNAVVQTNPSETNNTETIAREFVKSLLEYKPIANLESVSNMGQSDKDEFIDNIVNAVMNAVLAKDGGTTKHVYENGVSNVDTSLNYKIIEDSDGEKQFAYYSDRLNDPIQNNAEKPLGMVDAAVAQANATISVVRASNEQYDNNKKPVADANTNGYSYFVSVANLMDVAMYYLSINLTEAKSNTDSVYYFESDGSRSQDAFYPQSYSNATKMAVYEAGQVNVASMYSIYSNLSTITSKLNNITDPQHSEQFPDASEWNSGVNAPKIAEMTGFLKDIINGAYNATESDLIGLANMNAWLGQAMTTENPNEFNQFIDKAYAAFQLLKHYDLSSNKDDGHGWKAAQQDNSYSKGFYYDSDLTDYDKRSYLFTQRSTVGSAREEVDITSQLNADELNKFNFYKKLVKECLARGWTQNENVTDKDYLDAALTNGKWLIEDDLAINSRRVFEVSNDDVIAEAHSDYEAKLTLISEKEERIEREMTNLETQQNAINTELEGLKRVINDNIKSTFKMFG